MSNSQNIIKYVKYKKVRIKVDKKREEITKVLLEFFKELEEKFNRYERIYDNR